MIVQSLSYKDYRNLKDARVEPSDRVNVIHGKNAQGKTNLLEAIWVFTGGKSFRTTRDIDLIKFSRAEANLKMHIKNNIREMELKIEIEHGKRTVLINDIKQSVPSKLVGNFCAVVFSPTHLSLIKDGPALRRKFLDTAICQIKPTYSANLLKYNHVLAQRNSLLKKIKMAGKEDKTLDIWDESLAEYASRIILQRLSYTETLKNIADKIYRELAQEKENLSLSYKAVGVNKDLSDVSNIKSELIKKLEETRKEDIALGFTNHGPHKDELEIRIDKKSARFYASQGQQRSAVLAMKLAEASIVDKSIDEKPVILLDDVMSELDKQRQDYILNSITNWQVFITCCEDNISGRLNIGKTFRIEDGNIYEE